MKSEIVDYQCDGVRLKGKLYYNEEVLEQRPVVIVAHAWKGCDQFALDKAKLLAELGYVGFAADLYGNATIVESNEDALELMVPLFLDRKKLRKRIIAAYNEVAKHERVDSSKIGAIGFCFGGTTVIELYRSGLPLKGVVSFHGLLGYSLGEQKAAVFPSADQLSGSLLILHGYQDPLVSLEDVVNIQNEFSSRNVDWQMHTYGKASHAFTNPNADEPESGMMYHAQTEKRAFNSMINFLEEVFA